MLTPSKLIDKTKYKMLLYKEGNYSELERFNFYVHTEYNKDHKYAIIGEDDDLYALWNICKHIKLTLIYNSLLLNHYEGEYEKHFQPS